MLHVRSLTESNGPSRFCPTQVQWNGLVTHSLEGDHNHCALSFLLAGNSSYCDIPGSATRNMTVNQPMRNGMAGDAGSGMNGMNGTAHANGDGDGHDKLVVAIDFGTTYSGVATVYSANPDDLDVIKTWPGGNGITSDKVPTEIAYDLDASVPPVADVTPEQNPISSARRNVRWGFQFKPEEPRLRCIKLFLDRNQKLPHFVSPLETASQLRKCDRTVMDAVSDYLKKVYEHTMETLTRRYGESFMSMTKVDFVLTVPAVW